MYGNATNANDVVLVDSDGTVLTARADGAIVTAPWQNLPGQHWTMVPDSTSSYHTMSPHSAPNLLLDGASAGGALVLNAQDPDGRSHFAEYFDYSFQSLRKALDATKFGTCVTGLGSNNPVKLTACSSGNRVLEWSYVSP